MRIRGIVRKDALAKFEGLCAFCPEDVFDAEFDKACVVERPSEGGGVVGGGFGADSCGIVRIVVWNDG